MSKVLIISLNSDHDIIASSYAISALKKQDPNVQIDILTNEKDRPTASILTGIHTIHTINAQLIRLIYENPLYSNAFAINSFMDSTQSILSTKWDKVINYSNDSIAAYFIGALNTKEIIGTSINTSGTVQGHNKWSIYQNFVASKQARHTIDKISLRNELMGHSTLITDVPKIKQDENYSVIAGQNFRKIRDMKGSPTTFIVGINLESAQDGYSLSTETYVHLIETLEESQHYKVVLLLNGKNYQKALANDLNTKFNNSLISINIDLSALPSVVTNLDAMISVSSNTLAIADILETKCIEIKNDESKNQSPIVVSPENYLIYCQREENLVDDIILALNEEFRTELPIESMLSQNPVHKTVEDSYGVFLTQIRGHLDIQSELEYHLSRSFFYEIMGYERNNQLLAHIKENTESEELLNFTEKLKSELTSTMKSLLAALRSLKGVRNSQTNLNSFISHLDNLIQTQVDSSIIHDIIKFFEGKIENINSDNVESNIMAIEAHLFELKSELQTLTHYLNVIIKPAENRSGHQDQVRT